MQLKRKRRQKTCFTAELFVCICFLLPISFEIQNKFIVQNVISGPEENVASAKFNSKTIRGELRSALLDGEVTNYDMEKGNVRMNSTIFHVHMDL